MSELAVKDKLETFFDQFTTVSFKKDDVLMTPRDQVKEILYLKQGAVKMSAFSEDGVEVVLHIFRPGAYFPIMLSLSNEHNGYYFTAIDKGEYQKAPVGEVLGFLKSNADVLLDLVERFSHAMMGLLIRLEQDAFSDAYQRMAALFVYLADRFGAKTADGVEIELDLHHQDLAAWLGIRRETASRQIEKLQQQGLVVLKDRRFILPDIEKLKTDSSTF